MGKEFFAKANESAGTIMKKAGDVVEKTPSLIEKAVRGIKSHKELVIVGSATGFVCWLWGRRKRD